MSFQEERFKYLDTMLYLMENDYITAVDASAQYWEDFGKWDEIKKRCRDEYKNKR